MPDILSVPSQPGLRSKIYCTHDLYDRALGAIDDLQRQIERLRAAQSPAWMSWANTAGPVYPTALFDDTNSTAWALVESDDALRMIVEEVRAIVAEIARHPFNRDAARSTLLLAVLRIRQPAGGLTPFAVLAAPVVIYESARESAMRLRLVVVDSPEHGPHVVAERFLGSDAMGVERWQEIEWSGFGEVERAVVETLLARVVQTCTLPTWAKNVKIRTAGLVPVRSK